MQYSRIYRDQKRVSGCPGLGVRGAAAAGGYGVSFRGDERKRCKIRRAGGCPTLHTQAAYRTLSVSEFYGKCTVAQQKPVLNRAAPVTAPPGAQGPRSGLGFEFPRLTRGRRTDSGLRRPVREIAQAALLGDAAPEGGLGRGLWAARARRPLSAPPSGRRSTARLPACSPLSLADPAQAPP